MEGDVLICADKNDRNSAFKFSDVLEGKNLPWNIYFHDESLIERVKYMPPAGIVLVYGESAENTWIIEKVKELRSIIYSMKPIQPVCALYFDPPEKRDQMLIAPLPKFLCDLASNSGEDVFQEFIGKLIEVRAKLRAS